MAKKGGKTWGVWLADRESALLTAYLASNNLKFSTLARQLVTDFLLEEEDGGAGDAALIREMLTGSEANILSPDIQIKALKATLHASLLLGEILGLVSGDREKAHKLYKATGQKVEKLVRDAGYITRVDDDDERET